MCVYVRERVCVAKGVHKLLMTMQNGIPKFCACTYVKCLVEERKNRGAHDHSDSTTVCGKKIASTASSPNMGFHDTTVPCVAVGEGGGSCRSELGSLVPSDVDGSCVVYE